MSKTLKVSDGTYEKVTRIASEQDRSISQIADSLLGSNLQLLNGAIDKLSKEGRIKEVFDGLTQFKDGALAYVCSKCGHPLDKNDEEDECPWCHAKLDWKAIPSAGRNWGGWVLGGLLVLGLISTFNKPNQSIGQL